MGLPRISLQGMKRGAGFPPAFILALSVEFKQF